MIKYNLAVVFAVALVICSPVFSQELGSRRFVILKETIELPFTPRKVMYFVFGGNDSKPQLQEGLALESQLSTSGSEEKTWLVASRVEVANEVQELEFSAIVLGERGEVFYIEPQTESVDVLLLNSVDLDQLRAQVLESQKSAKDWERQAQAQASTLRRLGADAETIARVSKVGEVQVEIQRMKEEEQRLDSVVARLRQFLRSVSKAKLPRNYAGREVDLTNQLKTLAEKTKNVEAQEGARLSRAQIDLERGMQVVEATKYENLERLKEELLKLRQYRMRLESETPVG